MYYCVIITCFSNAINSGSNTMTMTMTMTMTTLLLNINTGYKLEYTYNMIYYL